jgi:DNA invertase Pin-like site-specific DNA recombinase
MNYGYIRVSSDRQTVENQRFEITNFADRLELQIDGWIEELHNRTPMNFTGKYRQKI